MDKKVYELLNDQINKELYSAYLYLEISNYYTKQGLDGFASWYRVQAAEEQAPAMNIACAFPASAARRYQAQAAASFFSAPRRRLIRLPVPMAIPKPQAWIIDIMEKTTPTAADALVPIRATNQVSAVL